MPTIADRVKETTTTTGTGNITLSGAAPSGFVRPTTVFATNERFCYALIDATGIWEVGCGYLSAANTFVRETITMNSSQGQTAITLTAGTHTFFCSDTAAGVKRSNLGRQLALSRGWAGP